MTAHLKRDSLIIGLILMFVYTWPIDLSNSRVLPFQVPFPIYIILGWGFIFASLRLCMLCCIFCSDISLPGNHRNCACSLVVPPS